MLPSPREYEYLLDSRPMLESINEFTSSQTQSHALFAILENSPGVKPYSCSPCISGDNNCVTNFKLLAVRHFDRMKTSRRPVMLDRNKIPSSTHLSESTAVAVQEKLGLRPWASRRCGGQSPNTKSPGSRIEFFCHSQYALFDTQSGTGLPAPLGTAIKINPESLNDSAFLPATGPDPVYLST
jgi:hypothetical protein